MQVIRSQRSLMDALFLDVFVLRCVAYVIVDGFLHPSCVQTILFLRSHVSQTQQGCVRGVSVNAVTSFAHLWIRSVKLSVINR